MNVSEVMSMIDDKEIESLGQLYELDKVNTKITGQFILKSFIKAALLGQSVSLRVLETLTNNDKSISQYLNIKNKFKKPIDHSSIGKRLSSINVDYFKNIYENLVTKYHKIVKNKNKFHIFDSTIITISGKLMKEGLNLGGAKKDRHIKMSVSLKNSIPSSIRFCTNQSESSEDIALVKAINEAKLNKEDILLFDRGISKTETLASFSKEERFFITRVSVNRRHKIISSNPVKENKDVNLQIISDSNIHLFSKGKEVKSKLRLIKAVKDTGEEFWFLTNVFFLSAYEVTSAYKVRWSIEVLFKCLKQNLQFKQFVSHNNNGMQVYIYCLLVAAILFLVYKIKNKLLGYKIPKLRFLMDLNREIIKDIVLFCGGKPELVEQKL